jgi:cytochrome c peroxidase
MGNRYRLIPAFLGLICWPLAASAQQADDPAWRAFQQALGQPHLIAANADHTQAAAVTRPLPDASQWVIHADKFRLGWRLFHETRLATGNGIACVTCHAGTLSGADRRRVSIGVGGAEGKLNALSVFNAAFNFRQFWDGRAVTLEDQALLPIETDFEMANSLAAVLAFLQSEPDYRAQFETVYTDGVSIANMADAMAHFQRSTFIRLDTPFQRYLNGEQSALSEQEQRGWRRFQELGCSICHNGINLGGNSYQLLGSLQDYYGSPEVALADVDDSGVFLRSQQAQHRYAFRVPGLHGVATTPPYLHDGSITALEEVVSLMGEYQLGRTLVESDVADIVAFLRSLGGHFNSSRSGLPASVVELEAGQGPWQLQNDGSQSGNSHAEIYSQVLQQLPLAFEQLLLAMQAVESGEVAHFDFMQFQHLELIRYSRALLHPPASLPETERGQLLAEGRALHQAVINLEWPIADFLMAHSRLQALTALNQSGQSGQLLLARGELPALVADARQARAAARAEIAAFDAVSRPDSMSRILAAGQ